MNGPQTSRLFLNARLNKINNVIQFDEYKNKLGNERAAAEALALSRSSLRRARERVSTVHLPEEQALFFRSESGLEFLHRLVVSVEFVLTQVAGGGLRLVQEFYDLLGISELIATSTGTLQARIKAMEDHIIEFGVQQETSLASESIKQEISVCLDETYPSDQVCLVAIEPVSNLILLESLTDKQDRATWREHLQPRLESLNVTVFQTVGDEGSGLKSFALNDLQAHHSPDLFHILQDIGRALGQSARKNSRENERNLVEAQEHAEILKAAQSECASLEVKPQGRPFDFAGRIKAAESLMQDHVKAINDAKTIEKSVSEIKRTLSDSYHPFDLKTGQRRRACDLTKSHSSSFSELEHYAEQLQIHDTKKKKLDKAKRMLPKMRATLAFFWVLVRKMLKDMHLSPEVKKLWIEQILAIEYLSLRVAKSRNAQEKQAVIQTVEQLTANLEQNPLWKALDDQELHRLKTKAKEAALLFQRSSSNVEGRNGVLSQKNHQLRQTNVRKLKASTVLHNFHRKRDCGQTPAHIFFNKPHESLFEHLLNVIDLPGFSRKKSTRMMARHNKVA